MASTREMADATQLPVSVQSSSLSSEAARDEPCAFSVVIPTFGRPDQLASCLRALSSLDGSSKPFEVVVVVDGPSEESESAAHAFEDELRLTVLSQPHAGPATARNTGAAVAVGRYLVFTDDDCAPARDLLVRLAARFCADPLGVVGGRTVNAVDGNPYAAASQLIVDAVYDVPATEPFFTTNNLSLSAEAFRAVGGFDPTFPLAAAEDREFCDRCAAHGLRLVFDPDVVVYHFHALTLRRFVRQQFNYGRGASFFHRARSRRGRKRPDIAPAFYVKLLRDAAGGRPYGRAVQLMALAVLSQLAYAAGFAGEELRRRF